MQDVEDGQQLIFGRAAPQRRLLLDQAVGPELFATLQYRQYQRVLRREVAVEGGFGDPGTLDDFVGAHRANAASAEQLVGGAQYAFAGGDGRHGRTRGVEGWHNLSQRNHSSDV